MLIQWIDYRFDGKSIPSSAKHMMLKEKCNDPKQKKWNRTEMQLFDEKKKYTKRMKRTQKIVFERRKWKLMICNLLVLATIRRNDVIKV
jgi:hypothetical protein